MKTTTAMQHNEDIIKAIALNVQDEWNMGGLAGDTVYEKFAIEVAKKYADYCRATDRSAKDGLPLKGKIDINVQTFSSDDTVTIKLTDYVSDVAFVEFGISKSNFLNAIARHGLVDCHFKTKGLSLVGKEMQVEHFEFAIPDNISKLKPLANTSKTREWRDILLNEAAKQALIVAGKHDWIPYQYFQSQDSFFAMDGDQWARCTIRRWVELDSAKNPESTEPELGNQ